MKLSFKRIISLIAAAAMSLSSFSALSVFAEDEETLSSPIVKTASVAAQLRANGLTDNVDAEWTEMNSGSSKIIESGNIETTAGKHFGAFYYFDKIDLPEGAIVTKVKIAVYQGTSKFSGKPFIVLHTENPEDTSAISDIFNVSAAAKNKVFNDNSPEYVMIGETTMTELTDDVGSKTGERTESVEITGENIAKYFNAETANSYFLYNKQRSDINRQLSEKAEITVEYSEAEAVLIHGDIPTSYEKFQDAYSNAKAGDTIKLLNDATNTKGIYFNKGNLTIDGNGKTIHNGGNYIAFENSGELTVNNLTMDGTANLEIKGNTTINADNFTTSRLQINGSTISSKGTVKNSNIDTLKCYSKLTLDNTQVKNIVFPNVKSGTGDAPKITSNADFGAESIVVEKIEDIGDAGAYTLFDGEYMPESITINAPYNESYVYMNGVIGVPSTDTYTITAQEGITASAQEALKGEKITLSGNYAEGSLIVKGGDAVVSVTKNSDGIYSFIMPAGNVEVTGLINTSDRIYVVAKSVERVNAEGQTDNNNYYIHLNRGLGMTFDIPEGIENIEDKTLSSVKLHLARSNTAGSQTTNVYDQTQNGFSYTNGDGYIAQYNGGSVEGLKLNSSPSVGEYKLLLAYDSSVGGNWGNDYHVVNPNSGNVPKEVSQLPYLIFSFKDKAPDKKAPSYDLQTDTQDDIFQYHYAGGTTEFNNGTFETGKAYDAYLWVPNNTAPGELKGLVAIKMNLIEVPFAYSSMLKNALAEKNFGILFLVCQKDPYGYNNTLNGFYTRKDYKGDNTIYTNDTDKWTTDGKDAADILNEILAGVAEASGYNEIENTVPLITIGHSAASGFGNKSANWNKNRVIAQIHMKNGMSGEEAMVPGVPQLQYAAQYTEHSNGEDRDRSVRDARYHIRTKRAVNPDYLVSHIIEWGSGHYDWSDNATYMLTKYITKAIEARLPDNYSETKTLNDLTGSGYLMKPFEKNGANEQEEGYYRDYLQGWLSSGQDNAGASEADKKASFWFFDEEFAKEVNEFTNYAIPESPDSRTTGISGKTYSDIEPFMLMKDPSKSTYANTPAMAQNLISPFKSFASNPFSRYGNNRFINYTRMASPNSDAGNTANLGGYDTLTVDTYYMNKVPSITTNETVAYDGAGNDASYPQNTKAEFVPLIAPYEVVSSELLNMNDMAVDNTNSEAANVASVTRTTLRFHNNRVYFRSGNKALLGENYNIMDSYGFIKSPEIRNTSGFVTSPFKATSSQMNIPYVTKGNVQTIELSKIEDVNLYGASENPSFDLSYTSTDADLQKYTDVFVEYGPARAVRTVNETDGSYSWKIEVLLDEIPENASFPIEVNVVASNLGKWEKTYGATTSQTFNITSELGTIDGVTISGYTNKYDGEAHGVTVSGADGCTVTYEVDGGAATQTAPQYTDVCEHSVKVTVSKENCQPIVETVTVKIEKANSTLTAPVKKENLTYNDSAQALVTAGTATGGEMQYSLDGDSYSTTVPTGTDAKEYTVYYKVVGDGNHEDIAPQSIKVTIGKADITGVTITPYEGLHDGDSHGITVAGTQEGDVVEYKTGEGEYTTTAPTYTDTGNYDVTVRVSRGSNYNAIEQNVTIQISAEPVIAGVTITPYGGNNGATFDNELHSAVTIGGTLATDTITYKLNNGEATLIPPMLKNAGSYTVTVTVSRASYTDLTRTVTVIINKANSAITAQTEQSSTYDNTEKTVAATLSNSEGTLTYAITKGGESVSEMKGAGEYTVVISAAESDNYNAPQSVTVTFTINRAQLSGVSVSGGQTQHDGSEHDLLTVTGANSDDTITYKVDDGEETTEKPTFTEIGTYSVKITVSRGENYVPYEQTVTVKIGAEPVISGIEVTPYSGIYDKSEHDALTVNGIETDDIVTYRVNNGEELNELPKITNAGRYEIAIKITRAGYAEYSQNYTAVISAADAVITAEPVQSAEYDGEEKAVTASLNHDETELIYTITKDGEPVSKMTEAGVYTVIISADATSNYKAAQSVTVTFTISQQENPTIKPEIVITDKIVNGTNSSSVDINVKNPNEETANGVLIAALYSGDICVSVSIVNNGKANFNKVIEDGMTIKAFMWSALSGENAMKPILPCVKKVI